MQRDSFASEQHLIQYFPFKKNKLEQYQTLEFEWLFIQPQERPWQDPQEEEARLWSTKEEALLLLVFPESKLQQK
jgi:hypothetical protein